VDVKDAIPGPDAPTRALRRLRLRGRGFALPVVLLVLAVMSVLALKLVDESRTDISLAQARLDEATARNAADAGFAIFIARQASVPREEGLQGFETVVGQARVSVVVESESEKIDLNVGAPVLLAGIFAVAGAEPDRADTLAQAIAAFRAEEGNPVLHSVDELLRFPAMDWALLDRVRPYVTVYVAQPGIDSRTAPREVLMAIPEMTEAMADRIIAARTDGERLDREDRSLLRAFRGRGRPIYTIRARAVLQDGATFVREAVVDLGNPGDPVILAWRRSFPAGRESPESEAQ